MVTEEANKSETYTSKLSNTCVGYQYDIVMCDNPNGRSTSFKIAAAYAVSKRFNPRGRDGPPLAIRSANLSTTPPSLSPSSSRAFLIKFSSLGTSPCPSSEANLGSRILGAGTCGSCVSLKNGKRSLAMSALRASLNERMFFRTALTCTPSASGPPGWKPPGQAPGGVSGGEASVVISSVAFSASSLKGQDHQLLHSEQYSEDAPQKLEDSLHLSNGHDLALDLFPSLLYLTLR